MNNTLNSQEKQNLSVNKVIPDSQEDSTIDAIYSPSRVILIIRHLKGLSQRDLASEKVSKSYVSRVERMESVPTYSMLLHFCAVLQVDPETFFSYVFKTQDMTWSEAVQFISNSFM